MNIFLFWFLILLFWQMIKKQVIVTSIWDKNYPQINYVELKTNENWIMFKTKKITATTLNWITETLL